MFDLTMYLIIYRVLDMLGWSCITSIFFILLPSFFVLLSSFFFLLLESRRFSSGILVESYYLEFLEILYRFFFAWLLEIHRSFCGIACFLRKILILLRRFYAWLHVHDFYVSHGFVFSILSCQASDLGQGFYVLKFMGLLNQNSAHV